VGKIAPQPLAHPPTLRSDFADAIVGEIVPRGHGARAFWPDWARRRARLLPTLPARARLGL